MPEPSPSRRTAITIRDMVAADLPVVSALEQLAFSDPWPTSGFAELLPQSYARLRVAVDEGGGVCGYCVLLRAADEGEIANICTAPSVRGAGVGGRLLDDALSAADASAIAAVYLEVRESNGPARALYEDRGFHRVGRRRDYYQRPREDALVLRRDHPQTVSPHA